MEQIAKIRQWCSELGKNPLKMLAAGFGAFVVILCLYGLSMYRSSSQLQAQELQVLSACEDKYRSKYQDRQISFQGVYSERFGSTHIIVTGTMSYADTDGHPVSMPVNCDVDIASMPWVWVIR